MRGERRLYAWALGCSVALAATNGCSDPPSVEALPTPRETLAAAGKRLSTLKSAEELTAIASKTERVLAVLNASERDALARGGLRFWVDQPVFVEVAAPRDALPFWLEDLGFKPTGQTVHHPEATFEIYRRRYSAGPIGLGVNSLDRASKLHYIVFLRSYDPSRDTIGIRPIAGGPADWRMAWVREGVSALSDASKPLTDLPRDLIGAWVVQMPRDTRDEAYLARGRVWKTHVRSSRRPDQVAVALGSNPSRGLTFTWRTDPTSRSSRVKLALASEQGEGPARDAAARVVEGRVEPLETPDVLNDPSTLRHVVEVGRLEPATRYAYACDDGRGGWTPWRCVRTPPEGSRRLKFLYLGDAQCGLEGWGKLLASAWARNPDASYAILAGDLVDRGNERTNWDHFFLRAEAVFERLPLVPVVGNHEYLDQGPRLFRAFFETPAGGPANVPPELVYAFECAGVFTAVLDSTIAVADDRAARAQADWLDARLEATRAPWKIVAFHHPVYASHPWREQPKLKEIWGPIFDKHGVALVLTGHDHAYLRTHPLRDGRPSDDGTTYIVAVSGDKYCEQRSRPEAAAAFTNVSTYQTIEVEPDAGRLVYRACDADGVARYRFSIQKPVPRDPAAIAKVQ